LFWSQYSRNGSYGIISHAILSQGAGTPCTFIGTIAPLQTAITISSDGGIRVKIDIPQNQEGAALDLLTLRGKVLKITVEEAQDYAGTTEQSRKIHI